MARPLNLTSLPVRVLAPTATDEASSEIHPDTWPTTPPSSVGVKGPWPLFRPLKVYAFGPSLGRTPGNIRIINVRYEPLSPGPVGERVVVVDFDSSQQCFYE